MHIVQAENIFPNKKILNQMKKKNQQTLERNLQASESKKIVIEDLIEAFANADIPLEKINLLLPFFKKHLKEGGAIPQASTLRQIYLPKVFNKHQENLKLFFDSKPISIIMDET